MKPFLDRNFLLESDTAQKLYHEYAAKMPIIDYHCHLSPQQIAEDSRFDNITQLWLYGDHYKWRAMRSNGIDERYCTGDASDWEKFYKWAETVPYTLRNPLYHWTHLELQRYFGINALLGPDTAKEIFARCNELIQQPSFSVRQLLRKMNVKVVCTTDDPTDSLHYHQQLKKEGFEIQVLPAFRPDYAMDLSNLSAFKSYVDKLAKVAGQDIRHFDNFLAALKSRHDFFAENGCRVSDHGLEEIYNDAYEEDTIKHIFDRAIRGETTSEQEHRQFKSAMLTTFAEWDHEKGWVQQYHLGALRNNNTRMMRQLGPDTGWDSIGDFPLARAAAGFLDKLDTKNQLAKTILYNLNPSDNEVFATMIGNFNDGSVPGKVQLGSGWWFLDQKDGMIRQLDALSNMGLLSRFVGMLTDSRSFLSYPRHEYFRRILCNLLGGEIEKGEIPNDLSLVGSMVERICYKNAEEYFNFDR